MKGIRYRAWWMHSFIQFNLYPNGSIKCFGPCGEILRNGHHVDRVYRVLGMDPGQSEWNFACEKWDDAVKALGGGE